MEENNTMEEAQYEQSIKCKLENLLRFFAMPSHWQLAYLPQQMPLQQYDQHDMVSQTDKPLEAMVYHLRERCRNCYMRSGFAGFEHIDGGLCNEIIALCDLILFTWQENPQLTIGVTWQNATMQEHAVWQLMRRLARMALEANGWPMEPPQMTWEDLAIF